MAVDREALVAEFWKRVAGVAGMNSTARNPESPPKAEDCPVGNIFDLEDEVEATDGGRRPKNKRRLTLILELFVKGSSDAAASKELWLFYQTVKKALYADPADLGRKATLLEKRTSAFVTIDAGNHMKGVGIEFHILYTEDVGLL